jgi:hypothetical protein
MSKAVIGPVVAAFVALCFASPAGATDLATSKHHRKPVNARHHHHWRRAHSGLPGPVLSMSVIRSPTCSAMFPTYPNYAKASCRDYDGFLTAYDARPPTGFGLYTFRARYGLR